ncbi:MAG: hypothetical protein NDJ90_00435 [Oligoflexia bacterium]|nr:hypothetical protein [Oligoflexia bacterium]
MEHARQDNHSTVRAISIYQVAFFVLILSAIGGLSFAAGLAFGSGAEAAERTGNNRKPKVVYPEKTELDFEGLQIEGEIRNPGEFYFQHRKEEKFDSLVKRRPNFHREMLRDAVLLK